MTSLAHLTIKPALAAARSVARSEPLPINRVIAMRRLVEEQTAERVVTANEYAIVTYEAQRALCSCGQSFSQAGDMTAHITDTNDGTAHVEVYGGMSYSDIARAANIGLARVQQLISKGRLLIEGEPVAVDPAANLAAARETRHQRRLRLAEPVNGNGSAEEDEILEAKAAAVRADYQRENGDT